MSNTVSLPEIESLYEETCRLINTNRLPEAESSIEKISDGLRSLWGERDDRSVIVRNLLSSKLKCRQREFPEARKLLEEAFECRNNPSLDERFLKWCLSAVCFELDKICYEEGDYEKADEFLDTISEMTQVVTIDESPREVWCRKRRADLLHRKSEHIESEKKFIDLLQFLDEQQYDPKLKADVYWRLGWVCYLQFRYEKALDYCNKAWEIIGEADGYSVVKGEIQNVMGQALYFGRNDIVRAEESFSLAIDYFNQPRDAKLCDDYNIAYDVAVPKHNRSIMYLDKGWYEEAKNLCCENEEIISTQYPLLKPFLSKIRTQLAAAYFHLAIREGKDFYLSQAEELLEKAASFIEKSERSVDIRYGRILHGLRAHLRKHQGRFEEAVSELEKAMQNAMLLRAHTSGSNQERSETFSHYYAIFETMVEWQCEWIKTGAEWAKMEKVYNAMELSRSQSLQDMMNANSIDPLEGLPKEKAEPLRSALKKAEEKVSVLRSDSQKNLSETETEIHNQKLHEALMQRGDASRAIDNASPILRLALTEDRRPRPFNEIRTRFDQDKTLVFEYLVGQNGSYLLAYGDGVEPRLHSLRLNEKQAKILLKKEQVEILLGREDKNVVITRSILDKILSKDGALKELIRKPAPDDIIGPGLWRALACLWEVLVPDEELRKKIVADSDKTQKRLLILPDGPLARLSFDALVVGGEMNEPKYLLDCLTITSSPSANMYINLRDAKKEGDNKALTAGDPDYGPQQGDSFGEKSRGLILRAVMSDMSERQNLSPLPFAAKEIDEVEKACEQRGMDVKKYVRAKATKANVVNNVAGCNIVHFACHGVSGNEYGDLFASLVLTIVDPRNPDNDGFLTLDAIFQLKMASCELTVLGACDTNVGTHQQGEGTWSISRGFLAAGSRRVVASNWRVDDEATAELISGFVKNTHQLKDDFADSLRQTKISIKSNAKWQHPYYWAPFALIGTY